MNNVRNFSAIDKIQETLNPNIIDLSSQKITEKCRNTILNIVPDLAKYCDLNVIRIWVIGSSLTTQWQEDSDIDVNLYIADKKVDLKSINKIVQKKFNNRFFIKTHPINFKITNTPMPRFNIDSSYDLIRQRWIKKPKKIEEQDIKSIIDKCSRHQDYINFIKDFSDLKKIIEIWSKSNISEKNKIALNIKIKIESLLILYENIKIKRRESFKNGKDTSIPSANFRCENIIYKLLESYNFNKLNEELKNILF